MTNTIARNVTKSCHSKKARDCYILHTVLLAIMLLLIITIICYYYAKYKSEQKDFHVLIIQKWGKMNLEQFVLKIVRVIFLMA